MTLTTTLEILEPVDPEGLWASAREEIGIPLDHPKYIGDKSWYPDAVHFGHVPGGFSAAVHMTFRTINPPEPHVFINKYDEEEIETGWYIELSLDSTYGSGTSTRKHWTHLRNITTKMGITKFLAHNEFNGDRFLDWDTAFSTIEETEYPTDDPRGKEWMLILFGRIIK